MNAKIKYYHASDNFDLLLGMQNCIGFSQHSKSNLFNVCGVAQAAMVSYKILLKTCRSINFHDKPQMRSKHEE